jgi:hypothetical protein
MVGHPRDRTVRRRLFDRGLSKDSERLSNNPVRPPTQSGGIELS